MSIFSGLTGQSLRAALDLAKRSPQGLLALAITGVIAVLAIGLTGAYAVRHIAAFHARVQEEDERAAREEQEQTAQNDATRQVADGSEKH